MNKVAIIFAICFAVGCYADVAFTNTAWAKAPAVLVNLTNAADVNFTNTVRTIAIGKSNPIIYGYNTTEKVQNYVQRAFDAKSLLAKADVNLSVALAAETVYDVSRDNENYIYVTIQKGTDDVDQIFVNQVPLTKDGKSVAGVQVSANNKTVGYTYTYKTAILIDNTVYIVYTDNTQVTYIAGITINDNAKVAPVNVTGLTLGSNSNVKATFQMVRIANTKTAYTVITVVNSTVTPVTTTVYENIFDLAGGKFNNATNFDLTAAVATAKYDNKLNDIKLFSAIEDNNYGFYFANGDNFVIRTGVVGIPEWKPFIKAGGALTLTQGPKKGLALFWTNTTAGNNTLAVQTVDTKWNFGPVNTLITGADSIQVATYSNGNKYAWINQGQVYWVGLALNANILKTVAMMVAAVIAGIFAL